MERLEEDNPYRETRVLQKDIMTNRNSKTNPLMQLFGQTNSDYINTNTVTSNHHNVFLDCEIGEPAEYRELITILFEANQGDTVQLYINSDGGHLDSALAIIEGLKNTEAHVAAIIMGACHSAASFIAMYCHEVVVLDSAHTMIHTATFGSVGMTGNVKSHTDFTVRRVEKLINETYRGFLSEDEIVKVKSGMELWFDSEEIRTRMSKRAAYLEKEIRDRTESPKKEKKKKPILT